MIERLTDALRDRYRVEALVGRGGMATVYRAVDLRHDRLVAIKVMNPDYAEGARTGDGERRTDVTDGGPQRSETRPRRRLDRRRGLVRARAGARGSAR